MNRILFYFLLITSSPVWAQKQEVTMQTLKTWQSIGNSALSPNGKHLWYHIGAEKPGNMVVVKEVAGVRMWQYKNAYQGEFIDDGNFFITSTPDKIFLTNLYSGATDTIKQQVGFSISRTWSEWFSYTYDNKLYIRNCNSGLTYSLPDVKCSRFSDDGRYIVAVQDSAVSYLDFSSGKWNSILSARPVGTNVMEKNGKISFVYLENERPMLAIFDITKKRFVARLSQQDLGVKSSKFRLMDEALFVYGDPQFSNSGRFLFFDYKHEPAYVPDSTMITNSVEVWNYKDQFLYPQQEYQQQKVSFALDLEKAKVFSLTDSSIAVEGKYGDKFVMTKDITNEFDTYWKRSEIPNLYLVSLESGSRIWSTSQENKLNISLSEGEKYLVWGDVLTGDQICYDIKSQTQRNLTEALKCTSLSRSEGSLTKIDVLCWLKNDKALIARDRYDLWQIDPSGNSEPICLTGFFGVKTRRTFRMIEREMSGDSLLLSVSDDNSKYNGFAKVRLGKRNDPRILLWTPYYYSCQHIAYFNGSPPKRAFNAKLYVVQRQSDTSRLNLFLTSDFQQLQQITHLNNPTNYVGSRSIPLQWRSSSGQHQRGLLYVPLDLDTNRMYPVIFNYYELRFNERYINKTPGLSHIDANVAWYTSRDYLVFIPDIMRETGRTGPSALATMTSAVEYLTSRYKWIDRLKLGLQGHSHGGYITNYVATHCNLFAAAQSSAGYSDFYAGYGQWGHGQVLQNMQEVGQNNMGGPPWENPEAYWLNSAILTVDKVTTPILIVHNREDSAVPFDQGQSLFASLRRAGKKVWLLQYTGGGHTVNVYDGQAADMTLRQQQFFDHYLKGKPAPMWMTRGIPAEAKKIQSGLKLDLSANDLK